MSLLEAVNTVKSKEELSSMLAQLTEGSLCIMRNKDIVLVQTVKQETRHTTYPLLINNECYTQEGRYIISEDPNCESSSDIVNVILRDNYMFYN